MRALENLDFSFPLGKLTVNPIQVKRVDVETISQHIREIHERNTMGCARIEGYCFFFPFYSSSITGVRMRDLHVSRMTHEHLSASWNTYYKVGLTSDRVCACYLC